MTYVHFLGSDSELLVVTMTLGEVVLLLTSAGVLGNYWPSQHMSTYSLHMLFVPSCHFLLCTSPMSTGFGGFWTRTWGFGGCKVLDS